MKALPPQLYMGRDHIADSTFSFVVYKNNRGVSVRFLWYKSKYCQIIYDRRSYRI